MTVFWGLMIPLAGTTLGSACVFFLTDKLNELLQKGCLLYTSKCAYVFCTSAMSVFLQETLEQVRHTCLLYTSGECGCAAKAAGKRYLL